MGTERVSDPKLLEPVLLTFWEELQRRCKEEIPDREVRLIETLRSDERQAWLIAEGNRTGVKHTWVSRSRHQANTRGLSEAFDVGIFRISDGKYMAEETATWVKMVEIGKRVALDLNLPVQSIAPKEYAHWQIRR